MELGRGPFLLKKTPTLPPSSHNSLMLGVLIKKVTPTIPHPPLHYIVGHPSGSLQLQGSITFRPHCPFLCMWTKCTAQRNTANGLASGSASVSTHFSPKFRTEMWSNRQRPRQYLFVIRLSRACRSASAPIVGLSLSICRLHTDK